MFLGTHSHFGETTQMANQTPRKPLTKTAFLNALAEKSGLTKTQVGEVMQALEETIQGELKGRGAPGKLNIPTLLKIEAVKKPARPARKHVPNPFKPGEFMDVAAKPKSTVVKVRALKALKDMV